jgi:hypothetical protein
VSGSPPNDASAQIAGSIAVAVTVAASTELKALRDRLALLVDGLDRLLQVLVVRLPIRTEHCKRCDLR